MELTLKASYHPISSLLHLPPLDTQAVAVGVDGLIILNIDDYFRCHLGFLNLSESTFAFLVLPPFMFQMFQKLDLAWLGCSIVLMILALLFLMFSIVASTLVYTNQYVTCDISALTSNINVKCSLFEINFFIDSVLLPLTWAIELW